tara:strand:- start:11129 stop:12973 length:1845 start_codon:yes stop_codon:yes gene_type:complete
MNKLYTLLLLISFSVTAQMPVNLLTDGDFEANNADAVWTGNVEIRDENNNKFFFAEVATAGNAWDVNLSQAVTLTQGDTYTLSFEASTSTGNTRSIIAGIGQSSGEYLSATETITLTDTNDTYTHDFVASFAGPHRVLFDMGADAGIVVIDNVSLVEKDTSGTGAPNNLLLEDFSGSPNTEAFEGLTSATIEADPVSGGTNGSTLKLITNTGGNGWQGATIKFAAGSYANISTNKTIAVDVHATSAISIMAKVEDESFSSPAAANTQTHTGSGWETLIFTFTSGSDNTTTANGTYTKVAIFPNRKADDTGWNAPVVDQTIYIDNIKSTEAAPQHQNGLQDGDETGVDCGGASAPACAQEDPVPTDAPPTPPARNSVDVISVYGEAYGTAIGLSNTTWDKSTFADETIAGNVVLKVELSGGDFMGADLDSKIDAANMTHFHIDYWLAGDLLTGQTMNTKWSNHAGGNAETSSFQDYNAAPEVGSWKSRDIDITALTGNTSRDELAQLIISLAAAGGTYPSTIYIDNVYFYKEATASINDIEINVNVYPNPVKDILNVISAESIDAVRIFDLTGRVVKQATPNKANFNLDVADLSNGVYLVKLNAGNKEVTTKIIK